MSLFHPEELKAESQELVRLRAFQEIMSSKNCLNVTRLGAVTIRKFHDSTTFTPPFLPLLIRKRRLFGPHD